MNAISLDFKLNYKVIVKVTIEYLKLCYIFAGLG